MIYKTSSFIQDKRHETKSERFVAIKPEAVETVLKGHGFNLISLKTGQAKRSDRADHQTTIARYRSERTFEVDGLKVDIVAKIPHLYGAIELFLGTYRQICSNGLAVGRKFETYRIKHLGDAESQFDSALTKLVAQEKLLADTIRKFQGVTLSDYERYQFANSVGLYLLKDVKAEVQTSDFEGLLKARRGEDLDTDLWSVLNVVQENAIRYGLEYQTRLVNETGNVRYFNRVTRMRNENTSRALEVNRAIWDIATDIAERKVG